MTTPQRSEWIFVSYRRSDAAGHAGRLYERLTRSYGKDAVFFDSEKIAPGAMFPARLSSAVDAALVVVAVIGPDWLEEINKRAKKKTEQDFVRLELAQALRAPLQGAARLVIPVLMGGAKPPAPKALAPTLRPDLGQLPWINAVEIGGAWEAGYKQLTTTIEPIRLARGGGQADHAAMAMATATALRNTLSRVDMQALAAKWDLKEENGVFSTSAADLLTDLSQAVQSLATDWRHRPHQTPSDAERERVASACREMAVDLLKLGVDPVAARAWVQTGAPAPCETVGMAALVRAVAVGEALVVDPVADGIDFRPERHYELDAALDNGAAAKHQARVARGLWPDAFGVPPKGEMIEPERAKLAARIKRLTERDRRAFVVTAPIQDPSYRAELTDLAKCVNAVALGRQPADTQGILREPEVELVDAFCLCLEEVEKLT